MWFRLDFSRINWVKQGGNMKINISYSSIKKITTQYYHTKKNNAVGTGRFTAVIV